MKFLTGGCAKKPRSRRRLKLNFSHRLTIFEYWKSVLLHNNYSMADNLLCKRAPFQPLKKSVHDQFEILGDRLFLCTPFILLIISIAVCGTVLLSVFPEDFNTWNEFYFILCIIIQFQFNINKREVILLNK